MSIRYVGSTKEPKLALPIEDLGPPGIARQLYWVAQFPDHPRSDDERLHDRSEREFKVFALLSKVPNPADNISARFSENDGGSYLILPSTAVSVRVTTPGGNFIIKANSRRELSLINFECRSTSPAQARQMFLRAVLPFIDHASYATHSPIFIAQLRVEDPKNQVGIQFYTSPYRKQIVPSEDKLYVEMSPVYSMYREALNSHSDFYRFFCYYKILEGLLESLRRDAIKKAKSLGLGVSPPKQVVPDSPELLPGQRHYVGKPIKQIFDKVLRSKYRTAFAHFKTDGGMVLHAGEPEKMDQYRDVILLCDLCVRKMIAEHEELLKEIYK